MSSFKNISWVFVFILAGCAQTRNGFVLCNDVDSSFFARIPLLSKEKPDQGIGFDVIDSVRVFRAAFAEKEVAIGNVLTYSELPEESKRGTHYLDRRGYSQELYLYQLYTQPRQVNAFVFFSVKYDASGQSIGFGPAYFGKYVPSKGRIQFFRQLKVVETDERFSLKKKKASINLYFYFSNLQWMPSLSGPVNICFIPVGATKLEYVVENEYNKIAGDKPLILSTDQLFSDPEALKFYYQKTVNLLK